MRKITSYNEILTQKIELWMFSLVSLVKKHFSVENKYFLQEETRYLAHVFLDQKMIEIKILKKVLLKVTKNSVV